MSRSLRFGPAHGLIAGLLITFIVLWLRGATPPPSSRPGLELAARHVPEDASTSLAMIGIHYAPAADALVLPTYRDLFAVLEPDIAVEVAVATRADFERFMGHLGSFATPHLERFHAVEIGAEITTWSRDRFAAYEAGDGSGGILAPPRIDVPFANRAGDWQVPLAFANAIFAREAVVASFLFEGGDLVSTPRFLFVDANLGLRNMGRRDAARKSIIAGLQQVFAQEIIWLGDRAGEVPQHHMMMYMVPLDDSRVIVGDARAGLALLANEAAGAGLALASDMDTHIARFDRAAELLRGRGFEVLRLPVVVRAGGGSYVTYTNALFDRTGDDQPLVYLPTYRLPALDRAAIDFYEQLGYQVRPVDVADIYHLNGSLGCLVNVMRRLPMVTAP